MSDRCRRNAVMVLDTHLANTCVIVDFETTGMSPTLGDRAIEIGAVKFERGHVVDRFQELMRPGVGIPYLIEELTGITNAMVSRARPCEAVMQDFRDWLGDLPLVAHNAAFDRRFLQAEGDRIGWAPSQPMACSLLLARRLCRGLTSHKLGLLVDHLDLPTSGTYHRALADAEMTAHLWSHLARQVVNATGIKPVPFDLLMKLSRQPIRRAATWLADRRQAA